MTAWVEMATSRDRLVLQLFLLVAIMLAIGRLVLFENRRARLIAFGGICVVFFATLAIGWLLR